MNYRRVLTINKKTLRRTLTNSTFIIALIMQLLFVLMSIMVVKSYVGILFPTSLTSVFNIGVYPKQPSDIMSVIRAEDPKIKTFTSLDDAIAQFQRGRICALIVLPENAQNGVLQNKQVVTSIISDSNNIFSLICRNYAITLLSNVNYKLKLTRASQYREDIVIPDFKEKDDFRILLTLYFLVVPFLFILSTLFLATMIIDIFNADIERRFAEIMLTVASGKDIVMGRILAFLIIGTGQFTVWISILYRKNIHIINPAAIVIYTLTLSFVFCAISTFFIIRFKERKTANMYFTNLIIFLVPLFFVLNHNESLKILSPFYTISSSLFTFSFSWVIPSLLNIALGYVFFNKAALGYETLFESEN